MSVVSTFGASCRALNEWGVPLANVRDGANKNRVFIKRAEGTKEEEFPLTSTTQVAPGDTIRIGERFF
jgi:hypothetical protein